MHYHESMSELNPPRTYRDGPARNVSIRLTDADIARAKAAAARDGVPVTTWYRAAIRLAFDHSDRLARRGLRTDGSPRSGD